MTRAEKSVCDLFLPIQHGKQLSPGYNTGLGLHLSRHFFISLSKVSPQHVFPEEHKLKRDCWGRISAGQKSFPLALMYQEGSTWMHKEDLVQLCQRDVVNFGLCHEDAQERIKGHLESEGTS